MPTKVVLHFRKNSQWYIYIKRGVGFHIGTFITMHPLQTYYLNQACRDLYSTPVIVPIYSAPLYLQREHGIGDFLGTLFRFVRPLIWTVCRTGGKIITDIAKKNSPDVRAVDIISKYVGDTVTESTHCLISKFRDRGLRRVRRETSNFREAKSLKRYRQRGPGL